MLIRLPDFGLSAFFVASNSACPLESVGCYSRWQYRKLKEAGNQEGQSAVWTILSAHAPDVQS